MKLGVMVVARHLAVVDTEGREWLYWFVQPDGMSVEEGAKTQESHCPVASKEEMRKSQRDVCLVSRAKLLKAGTETRLGANCMN
jgi:hypothetical protein